MLRLEGRTQREVAELLGIARSTVATIENKTEKGNNVGVDIVSHPDACMPKNRHTAGWDPASRVSPEVPQKDTVKYSQGSRKTQFAIG
jgi:hypothetical protein